MQVFLQTSLIFLAFAIAAVTSNLIKNAFDEYLIWPRVSPRITVEEARALTAAVAQYAGGEDKVYHPLDLGDKIEIYWLAMLPTSAIQLIKDHPTVGEVVQNRVAVTLESDTSIKKSRGIFPNEPFVTQTAAPSELRVISQPSGTADVSHYQNYIHYPAGARTTYIYHPELGINPDHADFQGRPVEWLFTGLQLFREGPVKSEAPAGKGHSTCTASKAAGRVCGSAKNAQLVVVKMPDLTAAAVAEVLHEIVKDIKKKGREGVSVVSVSWASIRTLREGLGLESTKWFHALIALRRMNVTIVCAAGNHAEEMDKEGNARTITDTAPAGFPRTALLYPKSWPFVVVSNSDNYGKKHPTSQELDVSRNIYAPGVDVQCASHESSTAFVTATGSSTSAALVAGVIAELLAVEKITDPTPFQVLQNMTQDFGWTRPNDGQYVIWNQVPLTANPPTIDLLGAMNTNQTSEA
ncbi:MAG: hypothetical protein Q9220_002855 [cf. Caloplaca sp. 1 TL-2023]